MVRGCWEGAECDLKVLGETVQSGTHGDERLPRFNEAAVAQNKFLHGKVDFCGER